MKNRNRRQETLRGSREPFLLIGMPVLDFTTQKVRDFVWTSMLYPCMLSRHNPWHEILYSVQGHLEIER